MAFHPKLIHLPIVEAAEFRRQAAERPNERKLRRGDVNDGCEARFPLKREAIFGFALHLRELIPRREKISDQVAAANSREGKINDFVGGIEGATYQIAPGLDVSRPWHDDVPENRIGTRPEALQSALFDQVIAELTESKYDVAVVAEMRTRDHGKPKICETRPVAVAVLEAEIHHPANDERRKIVVAVMCWHDHFAQEVHSVEDLRVGHQGQVNQCLNFPATKLRPDAIVLAHYFIAGRVQRPIRADASQVFKTYLDPAIALIQNRVKRHTQTCDESDIVSAFGALREHQKPILRRRQIGGQQFTLGRIVFVREDEVVVFIPALFG